MLEQRQSVHCVRLTVEGLIWSPLPASLQRRVASGPIVLDVRSTTGSPECVRHRVIESARGSANTMQSALIGCQRYHFEWACDAYVLRAKGPHLPETGRNVVVVMGMRGWVDRADAGSNASASMNMRRTCTDWLKQTNALSRYLFQSATACHSFEKNWLSSSGLQRQKKRSMDWFRNDCNYRPTCDLFLHNNRTLMDSDQDRTWVRKKHECLFTSNSQNKTLPKRIFQIFFEADLSCKIIAFYWNVYDNFPLS